MARVSGNTPGGFRNIVHITSVVRIRLSAMTTTTTTTKTTTTTTKIA
jgi:hypothetical protein